MKAAKRVVCLVAAMVMVLSLVACGEKGLVGTWEASEGGVTASYTFNKDGTGSMSLAGAMSVNFKYTTGDNGKLTITIEVAGQSQSQDCTYKVDGDKLELTMDGTTGVFTRK